MWSQNVKTNLEATFLKLIDKIFTKDHSMQSIFNREFIKISYRTMPNLGYIISAHNTKLIQEAETNNKP